MEDLFRSVVCVTSCRSRPPPYILLVSALQRHNVIGQNALDVTVTGKRRTHECVGSCVREEKQCDDAFLFKPSAEMPTSPVKIRIPLTSFGHLITEVKRQLFGIQAPTSVELTGLRKYFNSYTLQGRRNCVVATYGVLVVTAAAYMMHRQHKKENQTSSSTA
ncbi:unnamed protein product [Scomber scombrus]|uniref:Unnamed protein product n=1 Tax=Scomber scombrus TaxID=13677 RepID=A0AAV1PII0_SCOSC